MSEEFQKYGQLVRDEDGQVSKIESYKEAITALLILIHKRGASDLHLLTIEEMAELYMPDRIATFMDFQVMFHQTLPKMSKA